MQRWSSYAHDAVKRMALDNDFVCAIVVIDVFGVDDRTSNERLKAHEARTRSEKPEVSANALATETGRRTLALRPARSPADARRTPLCPA